MPLHEVVRRDAVIAALARLEAEHAYGFPEFWNYLAEAEAAIHQIESASGAVSDTDVSSPLADLTNDRIVANSAVPAVPVAPGNAG